MTERPKPKDITTARRLGLVRQRHTKPELVVRQLTRSLGAHYRLNCRTLPGSPDLSNQQNGWAIFVNGCFWHGHRDCVRATVPKNNRAFWIAKFAANRHRDQRVQRQLKSAGLRVLVIWECDTIDRGRLETRLLHFLQPRRHI
jgi:DNA mismatch endonuclease (patch repair protein)